MPATHEEKVCAAIVCDVLGARWHRIENSHDFDVEFPGGRRDYLEVGAYANEAVERRWHQNPPPRESNLASSWTLIVTAESNLRTIQQDSEPHLAVLEDEGIDTYTAADHFVLLARLGPTQPVVQASAALWQAGVEDARALNGGPEHSEIFVAQTVSTVGSLDRLVNDAAASVAQKIDNISKLTSGIAMTHLFIPVRMTGGGVWSAMNQDPPPETPSIDPAIGRVWMLGRGERVHFFDNGGPWQTALFNLDIFDDPDAWEA